jgi:PAB-dependent poly(A)-specific ribonuclease subunit 2
LLSTKLEFSPPAKIPPQVLNTMKTNDNVAYAALPKELRGRPNMVLVGSRNDSGKVQKWKNEEWRGPQY